MKNNGDSPSIQYRLQIMLFCGGKCWCSYRDPIAYLAVPMVAKESSSNGIGMGANLVCYLLHDLSDGHSRCREQAGRCPHPHLLLCFIHPHRVVLYEEHVFRPGRCGQRHCCDFAPPSPNSLSAFQQWIPKHPRIAGARRSIASCEV